MAVRISGSSFSSIVFDQLHSPSDQEGLLIGDVVIQTENTISDAQIENQTKCIIHQIEKSIVCPTLRFFYDKKGNIIEEKLTELLRDIPQSRLLGWYKARQNSTMAMSLWERKVHKNLCEFICSRKVGDKTNAQPVFGLFTTTQNYNNSNRIQNNTFYTIKHGNFSPVKVHVINLGNTSSQYRVVETTANPIKQCTAVYQTHRDTLLDPGTNTSHASRHVEALAADMCSKLENLCTEVERSEEEISSLLDEMDGMRQTFCITISEAEQIADTPVLDLGPPGFHNFTGSAEGAANALLYKSSVSQENNQPLASTSAAVDVNDVNLIDFENSPTENETQPQFSFSNQLNDSFEHVDILKSRQPAMSAHQPLNITSSTSSQNGFGVTLPTSAVSDNVIHSSPPPSPVY